MKYIPKVFAVLFIISSFISLCFPATSLASYRFADFSAKPPIHVYASALPKPKGLTPSQIKAIYNLPKTGGKGTIAIIGAYNDTRIESDLAAFDAQFGLSACTIKNGCLEQHLMNTITATDPGWGMETSLDVEWSHAISPNAKILLVEAKTQSGANMLSAIDYASSRKDVVAISMSWGGPEFSDEVTLDSHFKSISGASFFASSGDTGTGANWPAASPNVIAVGGTSLALNSKGALSKETAWSGSGGGVSAYEKEPSYQTKFGVPKSNGMRAIPDVSYDADPVSGFPIYYSTTTKNGGWYTVGGTSAAAPQWAAIQALGHSATLAKLYADKSSSKTAKYFRDISSGSNGVCIYYCAARTHYDYVTGLGSPVTIHF